MPIDTKDGRSRSRRAPEEVVLALKKNLDALSPEEREALKLLLREDMGLAAPALLPAVKRAEYVREPVDIETFILDPHYLGATCDNTYPAYIEDLKDLFSGGYHEAIFTGAIGAGKCVNFYAEVVDVGTGRRRMVGELGPLRVPSLDETTLRLHSRDAHARASGRKPCVRLELATGEELTLSDDHPVFTWRGWVPAGKLVEGDRVATPRRIQLPAYAVYEAFTDEEVALAAFLLADGGMTSRSVTFTKTDVRYREEVERLTRIVGDLPKNVDPQRQGPPGATQLRTPQGSDRPQISLHGLGAFVRRLGLNHHARDKRIPAAFYGLPDRQVALLLNRYWACDGTLYVKDGHPTIQASSASEGLVRDLRFMLLRLGIQAISRTRQSFYTYKGDRRSKPSWEITVSGASNKVAFLERVGPLFAKEDACASALDKCRTIKGNANLDVVPIQMQDVRRIAPGKLKKYALVGASYMSRDRFERMCEETEYQGPERRYATSDVLWSPVAKVEPVGEQDVYDLSVDEHHNFVANNIVVHNSFAATIGVCRVLYELSCMRDPQPSFGLARDSNISIVVMSVTEALAIKVAFENIATKIRASPYFQEHFPFDITKKELRFPHNIWVAARASTDSSALGLNVISGLIDETNFMKDSISARKLKNHVSKAASLYAQMLRRMKSRFERHGRLPGMLFIVSSKNTEDDFTAVRVRQSQNDPTVFVRDYALWDVKPDVYDLGRFHVLCGNETIPSKILTDEEHKLYQAKPIEGVLVIAVPETFRPDFERDLEGSIKDIAGISVVAVHPFIQMRDRIQDAVDTTRRHPFSTESYDMSVGGHFEWGSLVSATGGTTHAGELLTQPIVNPRAPRHIHIDIGLRKDAAGFAMSHIAGYTHVERRGREGAVYQERAPVFVVDLMLQILPAVGQEVMLADLRHLVYDLSSRGFVIGMVTLDSHQSADTIQQLNARGYNARLLSMDITPDPYDHLKLTLYEKRIRYYNYRPVMKELRELEEHHEGGGRRKIDHPSGPGKSKDVADALCGTVYSLERFGVNAEPLPLLLGNALPVLPPGFGNRTGDIGTPGFMQGAAPPPQLAAFYVGGAPMLKKG